MNQSTILTAVILDFMGTSMTTPEEEFEEVRKRYTRLCHPRTIDAYQAPSAYETHIRPGTELVLYDFGGLMPGSEDSMSSQAHTLLDWAQQHPSALVMVVSEFTYNHYVRSEAVRLGLTDLPNVVVDDIPLDGSPLPEWWRTVMGITNNGEFLPGEIGIVDLVAPDNIDDAIESEDES